MEDFPGLTKKHTPKWELTNWRLGILFCLHQKEYQWVLTDKWPQRRETWERLQQSWCLPEKSLSHVKIIWNLLNWNLIYFDRWIKPFPSSCVHPKWTFRQMQMIQEQVLRLVGNMRKKFDSKAWLRELCTCSIIFRKWRWLRIRHYFCMSTHLQCSD